jgi:hypothetical protein
MRLYEIESTRKKTLVDPECSIRLSENAKIYVDQFFRLAGYRDEGLSYHDRVTVFKLIARIEELKTLTKHNNHNWDIIYASLHRLQQAWTPVIEEKIIHWARKGLLVPDSSFSSRWPEDRPFALCLTHDIDELFSRKLNSRLRAASLYRNAPFAIQVIYFLSLIKEALKSSSFWRKNENPPFEIWVEIEQKYGFSSSMFFLPDPNPAPHWEDNFYRYSDSIKLAGEKMSVGDLMRKLSGMGFDIGLHGSSLGYTDPTILMKEKEAVEKEVGMSVVTTRQHHLAYDVRYTPYYMEAAGFTADSSIGSNISSCYRAGTGLPFFHFDYLEDKCIDLLQAPLIIQDISLFRNFDMDEEIAFQHCSALMEKASETGSALTLLWHNDYFPNDVPFRVYSRILKRASEMGAWGCSLRDLDKWWRIRKRETCLNGKTTIGDRVALPK